MLRFIQFFDLRAAGGVNRMSQTKKMEENVLLLVGSARNVVGRGHPTAAFTAGLLVCLTSSLLRH